MREGIVSIGVKEKQEREREEQVCESKRSQRSERRRDTARCICKQTERRGGEQETQTRRERDRAQQEAGRHL